jgi:hypothetical protein
MPDTSFASEQPWQASATPPICLRRMPIQKITPWTPARAAAILLRVLLPGQHAALPARLNRRA